MDMKQFEIELRDALQSNDDEEASKLITASLMNVVDDNGCTPLHVSASNGDIGLVRGLIKVGACVNAKDVDGHRPIHFSVFNGKIGVVRALIKAGADLNAKDNNGATPLIISVCNRQIGVVRALIKAGADVNAAHTFARATPMHFSVLAGEIGVMKELIEAGADLNAKDVDGHTPATLALVEGKIDIFKIIQNNEVKVEKSKLQKQCQQPKRKQQKERSRLTFNEK